MSLKTVIIWLHRFDDSPVVELLGLGLKLIIVHMINVEWLSSISKDLLFLLLFSTSSFVSSLLLSLCQVAERQIAKLQKREKTDPP